MATNYTRQLINDYCVLDTETTGLSCYYDEIIEIGILKVRNNIVIDSFNSLVKPNNPIDSFITSLTGITNQMISRKPTIKEVKQEVLNFIGDDVIVGHNTSFDIKFLNTSFNDELNNKYIDTMQFARKIYPEFKHHSLSNLVEQLHLSKN